MEFSAGSKFDAAKSIVHVHRDWLVDLTLLSKTYEGRDVVSRGPAAAASRELTPIGPMAVKPPEESAGPARNAQTSPIMAPVRDYQAEEAEALFVLPK